MEPPFTLKNCLPIEIDYELYSDENYQLEIKNVSGLRCCGVHRGRWGE